MGFYCIVQFPVVGWDKVRGEVRRREGQLNQLFHNKSDSVEVVEGIFQKRVRVFELRFQTPRNSECTNAVSRCLESPFTTRSTSF